MSASQPLPPDVNLGPTSIAIEATFASAAAVATVCRFLARRLTGVGLWYDDWAAFVALVWLWILAGLHFAAVSHGLGRHVEYVSKPDQIEIKKLFWWYQIAYILAPLFVKISALFLYKRVFVTPIFVRLVHVMMGVMAAWGVVSLFVSIFNCMPVQAFWTGEGHCILLRAWVYGYGIINIALDFIVWLMPVPMTWQLHLSTGRRLALTLVFLLGLADCGVAVARLAVAKETFDVTDFTYEYIFPGRLGVIHPSLGIVVICLPTMRKLLTRFASALGLLSPSAGSKSGGSSSHAHHASAALQSHQQRMSRRVSHHRVSHRLKGEGPWQELHGGHATVAADEMPEWDEEHNNAIALALSPRALSPKAMSPTVRSPTVMSPR